MSEKTMTEQEYRTVKYNSSSSLKDFAVDKRKYHRKYILNEEVKEKPNKASEMGRLVETLLMEPDRFDDLFFMSSCAKPPTGMTYDFVYTLAQLVSDHTTDGQLPPGSFEHLAIEAYKQSGFKMKFETVLKKLDDPEISLYYKELLKVMYEGMTVVDPQDIDNAEKIVDELKTNPTTSGIVLLKDKTPLNLEVKNQFKILNYEIDGMKLKSMLDKVIINHKRKIVYIYDLKCTWAVEKFYKEYYLYRRAYIQGYLYYRAVKHLTELKDSDIYGYEVEPPQFIVCDSINYYSPLIYRMNEEDLEEAYNGFTYKDIKYPGVKQIISDLQWAIEKDIWNISRENYKRGGVLNIKE